MFNISALKFILYLLYLFSFKIVKNIKAYQNHSVLEIYNQPLDYQIHIPRCMKVKFISSIF